MKTAKTAGQIQIYTGNGKGKSTAAFGLAMRAAGHGLQVGIVQFMKTAAAYGESATLSAIPGIQVRCFGSDHFIKKGQATAEDLALAAAAMAQIQAWQQPEMDVLVLDEIINAIYFELVKEADVLALLAAKPQHQEWILTGRNASAALLAAADLVTEMREVKHYYQKGVPAREGIEY